MADRMILPTFWLWELTGEKGLRHGYVQAVDPRDALSRALTTTIETGPFVGESIGASPDIIREAPANGDLEYVATGDGFNLLVRKVICPAESRHDGDILGCGSPNAFGPDHEGWFDCPDCGLGFNPRSAMADAG